MDGQKRLRMREYSSSAPVDWVRLLCSISQLQVWGPWGSSSSTMSTLSNLQRQVIHGRSDVGRPKADSAKDSILETQRRRRSPALHGFGSTPPTRSSCSRNTTWFSTGPTTSPRDTSSTMRPPCRKSVRVGLDLPVRRAGLGVLGRRPGRRGHQLSRSVPRGSAAGHGALVRRRRGAGVLCASIGSIMVTEAIKLITGIGETLLGSTDDLRRSGDELPNGAA